MGWGGGLAVLLLLLVVLLVLVAVLAVLLEPWGLLELVMQPLETRPPSYPPARPLQFDRALDLYRKAVALQPGYAQAHCNIGVIHKERGDLQAAISSYEAALAAAPSFQIVRTNLAIALTDLGTKVKLQVSGAGGLQRGLVAAAAGCAAALPGCAVSAGLKHSWGQADHRGVSQLCSAFPVQLSSTMPWPPIHTHTLTCALTHMPFTALPRAGWRRASRCMSAPWPCTLSTQTRCTTWAWRAARAGRATRRCSCMRWRRTSTPRWARVVVGAGARVLGAA